MSDIEYKEESEGGDLSVNVGEDIESEEALS